MILIEPKTRSIMQMPPMPVVMNQSVVIPGIGRVLSNPHSPFELGVNAFYFEPMGLMLGKVLIVEPELPLPAVERLVTWLRALMVLNDATVIFPYRGTAHSISANQKELPE